MNRRLHCGCGNIASCIHKGEQSGHCEYTRVVPGNIRGFDIQVAHDRCQRWHHVFSADTEVEARAIEKYVRWAGSDLQQRASHRNACLDQIERIEREIIRKALSEEDWNQTRTAKKLRLKRSSLQYKMKKYDLQRPPR